MSAISTWSTTAASNNSAAPDGWPEGQAPSSVNNCARENMAAIRTQHEQACWIDLGHTPTRTADTTFTMPTDLTATYTVGRRIRITDTATLYGTITGSAYTSLTTITVSLDSGAITTPTAVALGILDSKSLLNTVLTGTCNLQGVVTVGDGGAEDQNIILNGNAQDYHIGLDDTDDSFKIGLGSALGTTDYLTIDSSGNVGIGTASPDDLLHIESAATPTFKIEDTTNTVVFKARCTDTKAELGSTSVHPLGLLSNGTERITIDSSGNVGINHTTNTWGRLNIHENSATVASLVLSQGSSSGNALEINSGNTDQGGDLFAINGAGETGVGTAPISGSILTIDTTTNKTEFIAALSNGSTATDGGYIQVKLGGTATRYIKLYTSTA